MDTGLFDGLRHGSRLRHDLEPRPAIEERDEALSNDLMVIDDEEAER
jgi:hypothetical protein